MKVYKGKNKGRYVLKTVKSGPNKGKKYRVYLKPGQKAPATKKRVTKKAPAKKPKTRVTKKAPAKKPKTRVTKKAPAKKVASKKQSKAKSVYDPSNTFIFSSGYEDTLNDVWMLPRRLLKKNRHLPLSKRVALSFPKKLASKIAANFDLDDYKDEEGAKAIIGRFGKFFDDLVFIEALKVHKKRGGPISDSGSPYLEYEDIPIELMDHDEFPTDFRWKSSPWGPWMKKEGLGEKNEADYQ